MNEQQQPRKTSLERLEDLEKETEEKSKQIADLKSAIRALSTSFAALANVLEAKGIVVDAELMGSISKIEEKRKQETEENLINGGLFVDSDIVEPDSVIAISQTTGGKLVVARDHLRMDGMPTEVTAPFVGKKVGDTAEINGDVYQVLRVLKAVKVGQMSVEGNS